MQTTKHPAHTPGPWVWHDDGYTLCAETRDYRTSAVHTILSSDGGECGYLGSDFRKTQAELYADKCLIAAAPDLLEALQEILACANVRIDDHRIAAFDKARAAVKKATLVEVPA